MAKSRRRCREGQVMGAVATEEHSRSPGQGRRRRGPGDASQGTENGFGDKRTRKAYCPMGLWEPYVEW